MKIFIWLLTALNLYFGANAALNALGVLRTSKFSKGATIAYAIIRNHNGHIRVEAEQGKGSVFHIYIPALSLTGHSSRQ